MKKLLGIMVLGLLVLVSNPFNKVWSLTLKETKDLAKKRDREAVAESESEIKMKSGEENVIYNFWAIRYNDFIKEASYQKVFHDYCGDTTPTSTTFLLDVESCWWQEENRLLSKWKISINVSARDEFQRLLDQTYKKSFENAKQFSRGVVDRGGSSKQSYDYARGVHVTKFHYYKRRKEIFVRYAAIDSAKTYAESKKEKKSEENNNKIVAAASGTGFFVTRAGHLITNHHVIEGCKSVKVSFKGNEIEAKTLAIDKVNDLAIIKTTINPSKVYSVSNQDVSLLQDIIIAGFPLGKKVSSAIKIHKGSVTALAGYNDNYSNFQTDATINQGNSGGPIMNQKGNVVGVAVATWVEEGVQGVHFAIKSSTLKTFAKSNSVNFLPPNSREMSNAELGKLITEGTVFLECWMTVAKIKKMIAQAENRKAFYSKYK
jgi:S1-C subfamily serine protease